MMSGLKTIVFVTVVVFIGFLVSNLVVYASSNSDTQKEVTSGAPDNNGNKVCLMVLEQVKKQNKMLSRDLGHIKRELLRLKYEISRPGVKEIFAGIGYVLGLFGIAAYMKARSIMSRVDKK